MTFGIILNCLNFTTLVLYNEGKDKFVENKIFLVMAEFDQKNIKVEIQEAQQSPNRINAKTKQKKNLGLTCHHENKDKLKFDHRFLIKINRIHRKCYNIL